MGWLDLKRVGPHGVPPGSKVPGPPGGGPPPARYPIGIRSGLAQIKGFEGVLGTITFDKDGAVTLPVTFKMVKDAKFIPYRE